MVTIGHGCLLAEVSLRLAQKSTTLTQLLVALANIAHADRKKVHLDLSDFFFHQLLVKTLINLHQESGCFLLHLCIAHLEDSLNQGLNSDQLHVKDFKLSLEGGDNLTILLVYMNKEAFKARVYRVCKKAAIKLQQGVEEKKLKTVIREEIVTIFKDTIRLACVLLTSCRKQNFCAPPKEHISLFLVVCVADKALPHYLDLLGFKHGFGALSHKES